jgi:cysteinyl-tRNA synthetase
VGNNDTAPYRSVLTHGFVVDGKGRKMSKSFGNIIAPDEIVEKYVAEILRLWVTYEDYRDDIKISKEMIERIVEMVRLSLYNKGHFCGKQAIDGEVNEIENLCSAVARRLLDRHEYADRTEVFMRSEFMVKRETPVSRTTCHEVVKVHARAVARRTFRAPIVRKSIGAEVTGMTACPCAQNIPHTISSMLTGAYNLSTGLNTSCRLCIWGTSRQPLYGDTCCITQPLK